MRIEIYDTNDKLIIEKFFSANEFFKMFFEIAKEFGLDILEIKAIVTPNKLF